MTMGDGIGGTKWGNSLVFRGILTIFISSFNIMYTLNILMGGSDNIFEDLGSINTFVGIFGIVLTLLMCVIILIQVVNEKKRLQNSLFTKFTKMFVLSSSFELLYFVLIYMIPRISSSIYSAQYPSGDFQVISSIGSLILSFFAIPSPVMYIFAWRQFLKYAEQKESPKIQSAGKLILIRHIISSFSIIPTIIIRIVSVLYRMGNSTTNPYNIEYPLSIGNYVRYVTILIFVVLSWVFFVIGDIRFGVQIARVKSSTPPLKPLVVITPNINNKNSSEIIHTGDITKKTIICERCGANVSKVVQFCNECGNSIN